jgi:repressor LexA
MIDAGILDGDLVIVKKQDYAEDGDIVAVVMDEDATVKYYYHEGQRIRFQPANESMEPIYMSPDKANLHIAGKVVGVVRKY